MKGLNIKSSFKIYKSFSMYLVIENYAFVANHIKYVFDWNNETHENKLGGNLKLIVLFAKTINLNLKVNLF